MAVAYDNSVSGNGGLGGSAPPVTVSFTVGAGSNRMLLVYVNFNATSNVVSGITYNGVAMTLLNYSAKGVGGNFFGTVVYGLVNPATGANNIVISWAGVYFNYQYIAGSYSGCLQSTITNIVLGIATTSGSANYTAPITTSANNSWAVGFFVDSFGSTTMVFTTGTKRVQPSNLAGLVDSNSAITPAGVYTFSVASSNTDSWQSILFELPPAAAATLPSRPLIALQAINRSNSY